MTKAKKWFARWDLIGLIGLVLAAVGIVITLYVDRQNRNESAALECRERSHAVQALAVESSTLNDQLLELETGLYQLKNRERDARVHYQRAQRYITALNAELLIGRTSTGLRNAIRGFKRNFGKDAFDNASAETWVEYLSAAGYPSALTDRQRLARNMIEWGLESGAANFMVLTPKDEDKTEQLIDALQDLSGSMAVLRDKNYLDGIQGIQNTNGYLAELERELGGVAEDVRVKESSMEAARGRTLSLEARQREAERQFRSLPC